MIATLFPQIEFDTVDSYSGISYEWIQSLPPEQKDAALYRLLRTIEAKPTLVELFAINQVIYRTVSGNTFTESADSVAQRTGCDSEALLRSADRKTILKGLAIAVEQNILQKSDRPGTSTEYSFKPVEEWLPEPVVRIKDIRTKKIIEFPTTHNDEQQLTSNHEVVRSKDSNNNIVVVSLKDLEEQQQERSWSGGSLRSKLREVSVQNTDTPTKYTPWKYVGQGIGRVYIPPELDADTGSKIESIHEATKEPRQIIVKRAVDLFYKQVAGIPNFIEDKPSRVLPQRIGAINALPQDFNAQVQGIPEDVYIALQNAGIKLKLGEAERLWIKYSDKFEDALAYTAACDQAGKIEKSKEGYFIRSLEQGWDFKAQTQQQKQVKKDEPEPQQVSRSTLTPEQREWYEWACQAGVCDGRAAADLAPTWNGELGVFVYMPAPNPMLPPWIIKSISQAMREFPM